MLKLLDCLLELSFHPNDGDIDLNMNEVVDMIDVAVVVGVAVVVDNVKMVAGCGNYVVLIESTSADFAKSVDIGLLLQELVFSVHANQCQGPVI